MCLLVLLTFFHDPYSKITEINQTYIDKKNNKNWKHTAVKTWR